MEPTDAIADQIPPRAGEFRIQLPAFEGPLDLLLHLIKKHELDILDLPVAFVTERYLEFIKLMQDLDLDLAAEYLLMAATLAHIKSKMLLPRTPDEQQDDGETGEPIDPRADLIRRLLEYQKYKAAAESLGDRSLAGRDVFTRGAPAATAEGPAPLAEISLFKLLDAFEAILRRTTNRSAFEVTSERITIQERMTQITDMLRERRSCQFEELFERDITRFDVVVTFLALLEMTKMHLTRIYQAEYGSSIHVQLALLDASVPTIPPEDGEPAAAAPSEAAAESDSPEDAEQRALEEELRAAAEAELRDAPPEDDAEMLATDADMPSADELEHDASDDGEAETALDDADDVSDAANEDETGDDSAP